MSKLTMPPIMYGTAWKKEQTTSLVVQAVLAGFRGVDTACQPKHYREDLVGEAIKILATQHGIPRSSLFIQTKFTPLSGQDLNQPLPYDPSLPIAQRVRQSVEKSIKNLGSEPDSVILHGELEGGPHETLEALQVLEELRSEGKILSLIGVSNIYSSSMLEYLSSHGPKIDVVQNRWYEGNGWDEQVFGGLTASGPRKEGWLDGKEEVKYQSFWTLTGSPTLMASLPVRELAQRKELTIPQTIYGLCQLWGITPLCGSKTLSHVKEALDVRGWEWDREDGEEVRRWMMRAVANVR